MSSIGGFGNPLALPYLPLSGGTLTGNLVLPATGSLSWTGRAVAKSPADGQLQLINQAGTNVSTNGLIVGTADANGIMLAWSSAGVAQLATGNLGAFASLNLSGLTGTGGIRAGATSQLGFTGRGTLASTADGLVNVLNSAGNANGDFVGATSLLTAGTMTATSGAFLRKTIHRFDWTNAMVAAIGAALNGDVTICTLPAKTIVTRAFVVITSAETALAGTFTVAVGITGAAYIDYVVASNAKAAANTVYGDATSEIGSNLYNGTGLIDNLPSFTGTTAVKAHYISSVGNLSTVANTTGSVYLETYTLP